MNQSPVTVSYPQNSLRSRDEDQILERGLDQWRLRKLQAIEEDMLELTDDLRSAQEGLGIAHRNPGEVRPDIIQYLWDKLNHSATELEHLEKKHQELLQMDLPHLVVTFKHREEDKPKWAFLRF